jgi:hypothetical protein
MITFHSRQSDSAQRARKNESADTFNFTSQIVSSIYTVTFTKCEKSDTIIFKSRCSRTVVCYRFDRVYALPLIFIRLSQLANGSLTNRRNPARRSRNVREPSSKKSGEMSRLPPHNFPAIARQRQKQYHLTAARVSRETTRNLARNHPAAAVSPSAQQTVQHPANHLAR